MLNKPGKSASSRFTVNKDLFDDWKNKIEKVHTQLDISISFWKNKQDWQNEYPNRPAIWGIFS
tara:strand:- start:884 stop:1072 length:189 start_codon:yes stop_codon:yes gene_type:complete